MDKLTLEALKSVYVWLPVRVEEVGTDSLLKVLPMTYNEGLELPIINDVPVLHLGNENSFINIKVNVGDMGVALFSQMDISEFMEKGVIDSCDSSELFNLTNCSFLPVKMWKTGGTVMPTDFDFEITGKVKIVGDLVHEGNLSHTGNTTQIGRLENNSANIGGIEFSTHKHGGVQGGPGDTGVAK